MKNLVLIILILSISSAYQTKEKDVFICTSKSSKRYHLKKDCRGIKKCKSKIKTISKKKAKNVGRTLCKLEQKSK